MRMILVSVATLAIAAFPAQAQERMQNIVVTASRISVEDTVSAPAIYRRVPADFVLVAINYQSGTRDTGDRKREMEASFNALKKAAASTDGFKLQGGEIGESSSAIDTILFTDIYNAYGTTGSFSLVLSIDTREGETFDVLMKRAEAFGKSIKSSGRAEGFLGDEQFLGARGTDKHRADLLKDISEEVRALRSMFTPAIVSVTGLESRVITQPSGPLELEIFIPYTLNVESGRKGN